MQKPKYEIGQEVWWATCETEETSLECPHCGGTGRLRVIFHDETTVSIECENCAVGYDPPTGRVKCSVRKPTARMVIISGVEVRTDGEYFEYRTTLSYIVPEEHLFEAEADALEKATQISVERDREERERVLRKEKDARSWAWNASYHRNEIKRAEKNIEYHKAKLAVANLAGRAAARR